MDGNRYFTPEAKWCYPLLALSMVFFALAMVLMVTMFDHMDYAVSLTACMAVAWAIGYASFALAAEYGTRELTTRLYYINEYYNLHPEREADVSHDALVAFARTHERVKTGAVYSEPKEEEVK